MPKPYFMAIRFPAQRQRKSGSLILPVLEFEVLLVVHHQMAVVFFIEGQVTGPAVTEYSGALANMVPDQWKQGVPSPVFKRVQQQLIGASVYHAEDLDL